MNETSYLILLVLLTLILLVILVLLGLVIYLVVKKEFLSGDKNQSPAIKEEETAEFIERLCHFHPEDRAKGSCAICEKMLCEKCLLSEEHLNFCHEHFSTYSRNEWKKVFSTKVNPQNPDFAAELYDIKNSIWNEHQFPVYIETQHKINVENDQIESYMHLYSISENLSLVTQVLNKFNLSKM